MALSDLTVRQAKATARLGTFAITGEQERISLGGYPAVTLYESHGGRQWPFLASPVPDLADTMSIPGEACSALLSGHHARKPRQI